MSSPFLIEVIRRSTGLKIGAITTATAVNETRSLDRIGQISFTCPAGAPGTDLITPGCLFDVYVDGVGKIGRFVFRDRQINLTPNSATITVNAENLLAELRDRIVPIPIIYSQASLEVVLFEVMRTAQFSQPIVSIDQLVSVNLDWGTVYAVLENMRELTGGHFRLSDYTISDPPLEFGNFGVDTGLTLLRHFGQIDADIHFNQNTAVIQTFSESVSTAELWNFIHTAGAGSGDARLFLRYLPPHEFPILTYTADGRGAVYDIDSFTEYGQKSKAIIFSNIKMTGSSSAEDLDARNAVYYAAEDYLRTHNAPKKTYQLSTLKLPFAPGVGDLITLEVSGSSEDLVNPYLYVNDQFIVLDLTRQWGADGSATANFQISETGLRKTTAEEVIASTVSSVEQIKLVPNPSIGWVHVRERDDLYNYDNVAERVKRATARLELNDASIQSVLSVIVTLRTYPMNTHTNVNFATSGYNFVAYNGYNYPQGISFYLNGVDITADLGGPWVALGDNRPYEGEFDITDYINQDPFQSHLIEIGCTSSFALGSVEVPGYPAGSGYTSNGFAEITIRARIVVR